MISRILLRAATSNLGLAAAVRFQHAGTGGKVIKAKPGSWKDKSPIVLTEAAAERISNLLSKKEDAIGLRIGTTDVGCSGASYTMNYVYGDEAETWDGSVCEQFGVTVFIPSDSLMSIVGTRVDWKEDDLVAQFTFENPNAVSTCGCGESFST